MKVAATEFGVFHHFDDDIGRRIAGGEFFDSHLRPWLDKVQPGDNVVDVGANIGFHTVYCAKKGAKVFAFEPGFQVAMALLKNLGENNVGGLVSVLVQALYSKECMLGINPQWTDWAKNEDGSVDYSKTNSGGLSLVPDENGTFHALTLDGFKFQDVKLLKVDTQGSDLQVLRGGETTIRQCRPIVCFEYEDGGTGKNASGDSMNDFLEFFENMNYAVRKLCDTMHGSDYVAVPA